MKTTTILKDELSLLKSDKSALVNELTKVTEKLTVVNEEVSNTEAKLKEVQEDILTTTTRYEDLLNRVVFVKDELVTVSGKLHSEKTQYDSYLFKNSQEQKNHLGRKKEKEEEIQKLTNRAEELKLIYDKNYSVFVDVKSSNEKEIRDLDIYKQKSRIESLDIDKLLVSKQEEEKKFTKERLKREDKIRLREATLEVKIKVQDKREEDLIAATRDIAIVYNRLKDLYEKVDPSVNLDRLIQQV